MRLATILQTITVQELLQLLNADSSNGPQPGPSRQQDSDSDCSSNSSVIVLSDPASPSGNDDPRGKTIMVLCNTISYPLAVLSFAVSSCFNKMTVACFEVNLV